MYLVVNDFGHERDVRALFTWNVTALVNTDFFAVALVPLLAFFLLFLGLSCLTFLTHRVIEGLKFDLMRLAHKFTLEMFYLFKVGVSFAEALYC